MNNKIYPGILKTALKNRFIKEIGDDVLEFHLQNININGEKRGCFGFIKNKTNGKIVYVNTEPVCYNLLKNQILYREAQSLHDWTGSRNHWSKNGNLIDDVLKMLAL